MSKNPLLEVMENHKLTQADVAAGAGIDGSVVSQIINGYKSRPSSKVLTLLAQFGYDPDEFTARYVAWRQEKAQAILATKLPVCR